MLASGCGQIPGLHALCLFLQVNTPSPLHVSCELINSSCHCIHPTYSVLCLQQYHSQLGNALPTALVTTTNVGDYSLAQIGMPILFTTGLYAGQTIRYVYLPRSSTLVHVVLGEVWSFKVRTSVPIPLIFLQLMRVIEQRLRKWIWDESTRPLPDMSTSY